MIRTLTEILKESDKATKLNELISLWNEIVNNKYQYTVVQLLFANEHIKELSLKVEGFDIDKGLFYHRLNEMYKMVR